MRVVVIGATRGVDLAIKALVDCGADVVGIFTFSPDMLETTSMEISYYADVVGVASRFGIPVSFVRNVNRHASQIASLTPDVIYVVGWPQIVRNEILSICVCLGMHPSPLPKRRGGAPLNWQIIDGESESALTIFRLGSGIDDGDILVQLPFRIEPLDYIADVIEKTSELTYEAVRFSYLEVAGGSPKWIRQDSSAATVMRRRRPEDGLIKWDHSCSQILNLIRAVSNPFPGAFSYAGQSILRVWRAKIPLGLRPSTRAVPGQVVGLSDDGIIVVCKDYCIALAEVQLLGPSAHCANGDLVSLFDTLEGAVLGGSTGNGKN